MSDASPVHGLSYDPAFLHDLLVLSPPRDDALAPVPAAPQPIRALSASQFADIHFQYLLTHAPDSVLFPFLHGLEDGSDALRAFFGSSSFGGPSGDTRTPQPVRIPRFRGLVWVATDEPSPRASSHSPFPPPTSSPAASSLTNIGRFDDGYGFGYPYDDEDEGEEDDEEEEDYDSDDFAEGVGEDMDIDTDYPAGPRHGQGHGGKERSAHIHMHPVNHRAPPASAQTHDRRASTTSQSTVSSSYTTSSSYSTSTAATSLCSSPPGSPLDNCPPPPPSPMNGQTQAQTHVNFASVEQMHSPHPHPPPSPYPEQPFFLTSTFFARDLIKPKPIPKRVRSVCPVGVNGGSVNVNGGNVLSVNTVNGGSGAERDEVNGELKCMKSVSGAGAGTGVVLPEEERWEYEYEFCGAKVPEGISLRNFGVQVPIYATISDIVVYSPTGDTGHALLLAERFREAVDRKRAERGKMLGDAANDLVPYNVFVLDCTPSEVRKELKYLLMRREDEVVSDSEDDSEHSHSQNHHRHTHAHGVHSQNHHPRHLHGKPNGTAHTDGTDAHVVGEMDLDDSPDPSNGDSSSKSKKKMLRANTIDFALREKEEMRDLTRASEIFSWFPSSDASTPPDASYHPSNPDHTHSSPDSDAVRPVAIPDPRASASNTQNYWNPLVGQVFLGNSNDVPLAADGHRDRGEEDLFDCSDNDPAHGFGYDICVQCHDAAPFPTSAHLRAAEDHIAALEGMWAERCAQEGSEDEGRVRPPPNANAVIHLPFPSCPGATAVTMSAVTPFLAFLEHFLRPAEGVRDAHLQRPLKVLIHSSDGYTDSSVLALCLLMALRKLSLPEAYLELQVAKRRSFFVYQGDLALLKRVEARYEKERQPSIGHVGRAGVSVNGYPPGAATSVAIAPNGRPAANSVSISSIAVPHASNHTGVDEAGPQSAPALSSSSPSLAMMAPWHNHDGQQLRRPRASTSPVLPTFIPSHDTWFNDPRFDGSFPSRVLPFLYLGNLNHATNAYMLHALGITHVVSVGECALVPPPNFAGHAHAPIDIACPVVPEKGPGNQGSLWTEEREGRIKVLDIKGICDDGIDTLAPQLEPICEWIEKARAAGGQVLVHCRVGVSRSATVTIAYVMKHLGLPLVDAYLIVRSRRLSVLIQPNMRLLYNLLGWEVKLARERAGDDQEKLRNELARSLNWPYLAREVHLLNEKYLH